MSLTVKRTHSQVCDWRWVDGRSGSVERVIPLTVDAPEHNLIKSSEFSQIEHAPRLRLIDSSCIHEEHLEQIADGTEQDDDHHADGRHRGHAMIAAFASNHNPRANHVAVADERLDGVMGEADAPQNVSTHCHADDVQCEDEFARVQDAARGEETAHLEAFPSVCHYRQRGVEIERQHEHGAHPDEHYDILVCQCCTTSTVYKARVCRRPSGVRGGHHGGHPTRSCDPRVVGTCVHRVIYVQRFKIEGSKWP